MSKWRNDPKISRTYNYLYRIENLVNGNYYIGVHRTDNLNDGYMGSGLVLKRAFKKHGIENFKKEILEFHDSYEELLKREKEIVNLKLLNDKKCYNSKEGGFGNCRMSDDLKQKISIVSKEKWKNPEFRKMMDERCFTEERNKKISDKIKKWIEENPEKHQEKMLKINKNPDKIKKMADSHRGMKRSEDAKRNISKAAKKNHEKNPYLCGRGCIYIHNVETKEIIRHDKTQPIPDGWLKGSGVRRKTPNNG